MIAFIVANWFWIAPAVLEIGARIIPTKKNYSILNAIVKVGDTVIPNLKKLDDGSTTKFK